MKYLQLASDMASESPNCVIVVPVVIVPLGTIGALKSWLSKLVFLNQRDIENLILQLQSRVLTEEIRILKQHLSKGGTY